MKNNAIENKRKSERDSKVANEALNKLYGFEFGAFNMIDSYARKKQAEHINNKIAPFSTGGQGQK